MNGTKPNGKDHQIESDECKIDDKLYTNGFNSMYETGSNSSSCSEIEEIDDDNNNASIRRDKETNRIGFFTWEDKHRGIPATIQEGSFEGLSVTSSLSGEHNIYVAVGGKSNSSLDALRWTLRHHPLSSSIRTINLIHVFPEVILIPSPFGGKVPKDQVSPQELANYMSQQTHKRREFLQNFLDICSVFQVKVETLLIESSNIAKAVTDLILVLNIKKLVVGTSKSSYRKLKKANGIGEQILKSASDTCDIKIINNGKELTINDDETTTSAGDQSPASSSRSNSTVIDESWKATATNGQSSSSRSNSIVIDERKTTTVNGQSSTPSPRRNSRPSSRRHSSNNVIADFDADLDDLEKSSGSLSPWSCFTSKFSLKR
ncbi:hypothetical protein MKW94_016149 [Papaver nudicaule]|uniref:Uncharacterized protein n=1 Tax=Papaver nudicaule TaxID=74823 RepID=A0AA41SCZ4_PAPNU|nr:hypothetical protein [Papaver nudicaule]